MKTLEEIKKILEEHKEEIRKKYGVVLLGIFGSYARGDQTETSDVDIIVEFDQNYKSFDNYMDLKFYLESLLSLEVDLVIQSAIKPRLKPYILEETYYV